MKYTGRAEPDSLNEYKQAKKKDLSTQLLDGAEFIIDTVVDDPEQVKELQSIILMRNVDSLLEPSMAEVKSFLFNLPAYILSIHSQYLKIKFSRENKEEEIDGKLGRLRAEAEGLIIKDRLEKKAEGMSLSSFGAITKENLSDKIRTLSGYSTIVQLGKELQEIEYKEQMLKKVVDVLEDRKFELGKIVDIELKFNC